MKQLYVLLAVCLFYSQIIHSKPIIITGHASPKFRDSLYLHAYRYISDFVVYDKQRTLVAATRPDANGFFRITYNGSANHFYMTNSSKISVFNNAYLEPGDSLFIEIVDTSFGGKPYPYPIFHYYGSGAYSINYRNKLERHQLPGGKEHKMGGMVYYEFPDYTQSMDSFSSFVSREKEHNDSFSTKYFNEVKVPNSFVSIAQCNNDYELKHQKLTYIWRHDEAGMKTVKVEPSYFNFIKDADLHNENALGSHNYYIFLLDYPKELIRVRTARLPEDIQEKKKKYYGRADLDEMSHIIDSLYSGRFREIALGKFIDETLDILHMDTTQSKSEIIKWIDSEIVTLKPVSDPMDTSIYSCLLAKRNKIFSLDNAVAPAFTLPDTSGKMVSLSDLKGKVILLDFWEFGCMPCMQAIPGSNKLQKELSGKDFIMVGICANTSKDMFKMALDKFHWSGTHLLVSDNSNLTARYSVDGFPHYVLIDKKGIIRNSNVSQDMDTMKKQIEELMKE